MKTFIKGLILTGLWALLLSPFLVMNSMFFPYITGKNFAFRIIIEIIFALWVYLAYVDHQYRPKFSWVLGAVGLFVLVMLVADINAVNPLKALLSNFERMDGWVTQIHLLMYLLVFTAMMKGEKIWLWFFRSSVIAGLILSIYVINEWLTTHVDRVQITLGNAIYVAVYFLFNFFLALILLYKDVIAKSMGSIGTILKNWLTYGYVFSALLFFFDIWRTGTRGVILGLLGGLIVSAILIILFERNDKIARKSAIGAIIIVVVLVGGFFAIKNTQFVKNSPTLERLAEISWQDVAAQNQARQYVWPMAIQGAMEKPILGWGQDGFNYVFNKYYDPRMYSQEQWFDRAHDTPLDMLVAGGFLGLITYLGIFIVALVVIWKRRSALGITDAALLVGLLAAYFAQNLFVFDNLTSYIYFYIILAYIYAKDVEAKENMPEGKSSKISLGAIANMESANYIVAPILIIVFGIALYFVNIRPIEANLNLINGLRAYQEGPSKNLAYFQTALSYHTFGDPEVREQLISIAQQVGNAGTQVPDALKQSFAMLAYSEIQKQISYTPLDARYYFFAGSFLDNLRQFALATPYLEQAVQLSPKKQTMLMELAKNYAYTGQKQKALDAAKYAYNLETDFSDAKDSYVAMLILNGQDAAAKSLMGAPTTTSDIIIRSYLILAEEYLQKGDKKSAIAEINAGVAIAPAFKTQAATIIDGINKGQIQ
jgi:O-antigen ligase